MKLAAAVITRNEGRNIRACLEGLRFCDEIVVVDSGSADGTREAAREFTPRVFERPFDNFADQKNHAVSLAEADWVLSVDADERVPAELAREVREAVGRPGASAYRIPRRSVVFGRRLRFGAGAGDAPIRLFRKDAAVYRGAVHEVPEVRGAVGRLRHALLHHSTPDASTYMRKLNHYTALEARLFQERGARFHFRDVWLRPFGRFIQQAFVRGGVLDGRTGLVFALLGAYYECIRHLKFWEMSREKAA
jgi:glycosyltransferase involved in cell wall biosynthesis